MVYYPGLGMPINQFGYDNGRASLGPYQFLPWSGNSGATMINGLPSLNDMEYGNHAAPTPVSSISSSSHTSAPAAGSNEGVDFLKDTVAGKHLPYDQNYQSAQMADATDMSAAADGARTAQMDADAAAGGASANDPSLRGARLASMGQRQAQNQTAKREIAGKASAGNFDAQERAAESLNRNEMAREEFANRKDLVQMGYGRQDQLRAQDMALQFSPWGGNGGGNSRYISGLSGGTNFFGPTNRRDDEGYSPYDYYKNQKPFNPGEFHG